MTKSNTDTEGRLLVFYQSSIPVNTPTLTLLIDVLRQARLRAGGRWRRLSDQQAAVIVLAVLRHDQRPADLATAYQISHSTVRRRVLEAITGLAARAPRLDRVLRRAAKRAERTGEPMLLLDGTLIPTHRPGDKRQARAHYSGKHRSHGVLALVLSSHDGQPLWVSAAVPARTGESTFARRQQLPARLRAHDLAVLADKGLTRLDDQPDHTNPDHQPSVITGKRGNRHHPLPAGWKAANQLISETRATNEHAINRLKDWRILTRLRGAFRHHATTLLRAILTLTHTEPAPTPTSGQPAADPGNPHPHRPTSHNPAVKPHRPAQTR